MSDKRGIRSPPNAASAGLDQLFQRGFDLHRQGKLPDAERLYQQVLMRNPGHFDARHLLGLIAYSYRQYDRAVALISQAVQLNPDSYVAYANLGVVLFDANRPKDAIEKYNRAIALNPDYAEAYSNRANALNSLNLCKDALNDCDKAIALNPKYVDAHYNRGNVLSKLERFDEAVTSYDRAITLRPGFLDAYCNRGNALKDLNRPGEALASYDRAIALKPDYAEAHANRGMALHHLGRLDEALASYEQSMALKADYAMAHWNRGLVLLTQGQFERGWRDYEWRKVKEEPVGNRPFDRPLWTGQEPLQAKTILIHWEQGLGDTIQFVRLVSLLKAMGATVLLAPQPRLKKLLSGLSSSVEIVDLGEQLPHFDFHCPLMSLPNALGIGSSSAIPHDVPYLSAEPALISRWRQALGAGGFKVGVCWQGNKGSIDLGRSFPLVELLRLARIPGVRLVSLQKGEGEKQLTGLPDGAPIEVLSGDFDAGPDAFLDTAAVIKSLDLVITSDTAVAHLAGALGAPTWVALKNVPDWRWLLNRADSPWYPTMRLFRQDHPGDWQGLFRSVDDALRAELAARR